ncbi:MAG TPA: histidine kinase [Solirubrobacteraceae bacterium]|jgi:signal transduction histidine kinase|nr:histidine kinase [Solirubrobacteraceae bacterium]
MIDVLQRVLALLRRRPLVGDVVLVAVMLLPVFASRIGDLPTTSGARAFSVALVLPLLLRRRWPIQVFGVIALVAFAQWQLDVRAFGDAALLVALYTVAVSQPTSIALLAASVVEGGVVLALARWGAGNDVRAFVGLSGLATAATVLGMSTRNRRALVATLEERAARLEHERDQQGRLSAAFERARIAREMHDIVAHNVSVMIALADGAGYAVRDDPDRAEEAMGNLARTGRQALTEMRRLLGVLREEDDNGDRSPQPGLGELDALVAQVRSAGLSVGYEISGAPQAPPPPGLQLAIYRIVQEALTNTIKHAGPGATAKLTVRHTATALEVHITDRGGAPSDAGGSTGAGLRGMRERAAVYDGEIEAGPRPGGGWRVRLVVPLSEALVSA